MNRTQAVRRDEWSDRTSAEVLSEPRFRARKQEAGWHILGVMGYAGRWEKSGLHGDELAAFVSLAREALRAEIVRCRDAHPGRLLVCTGATNTGVLQLTYEVCVFLDIPTMSVAPDRALNYELGPLAYVIPHGQAFGDESDLFVGLSDELLLLGGGKQSHREVLAGHALHKPVTVIQGFGGTADALSAVELPGARFV
jgi:hypothetical protein